MFASLSEIAYKMQRKIAHDPLARVAAGL